MSGRDQTFLPALKGLYTRYWHWRISFFERKKEGSPFLSVWIFCSFNVFFSSTCGSEPRCAWTSSGKSGSLQKMDGTLTITVKNKSLQHLVPSRTSSSIAAPCCPQSQQCTRLQFDRATYFCNLDCHDSTALPAKVNKYPKVDLLELMSSDVSASVYPSSTSIKFYLFDFGYFHLVESVYTECSPLSVGIEHKPLHSFFPILLRELDAYPATMKNHNDCYDGTADGMTHHYQRPTYAAALLDAVRKALFRASGARPSEGVKRTRKNRLFEFTMGLSALACAILVLEMAAQSASSSIWWVRSAHISWFSFRVSCIARPLQAVVSLCIVLSVAQSVDRLLLCLGCLWIKLRNIKPRVEHGPPLDADDDRASEVHEYPSVLVQIPMCNEREVYEQSISAVCQFDWPRERLLIQVLDDSDDEAVEQLVRAEVSKWSRRGVNIIYRHRSLRTGHKAGNLKSAMSCDYVKDYEFVTIFDADFQPNPDFLKQTVPHFKENPELGLVQTRWKFVNEEENLITRLQNITLCFHFEVEQQVNGVFLNFFGFNGTAGVWRIKALEGSGGWLDRTTVEDMDIAVRAHVNGWKFILLNDVKVLCEAPGSFEFYRKQQYRWHSGPMDLLRFCLPDVLASKISKWKKANLILLFFLLRKLILPFYSFTLSCIILPVTMFVPEAELPVWLICYLPLCMSFLNVFFAPRSFPFIIPYILFENTMSLTKFSAMLSGLLQLGGSDEWIVTKKAGRSSESKLLAAAEREYKELSDRQVHGAAFDSELNAMNKVKDLEKIKEENSSRIYKEELVLAVLLLAAAVRGLLSGQWIHFSVLLLQGVSFLVVGLGLIGKNMR